MRFAKSLFKDSREQHRFPYRLVGTFGWLSEQPSHGHNIATGAICYEYFDADDDNSEDLSTIGHNHFVYDSPSIEAWLCRYWLENEIVFAHHDRTQMPRIPPRFIRAFTIDAYNEDT